MWTWGSHVKFWMHKTEWKTSILLPSAVPTASSSNIFIKKSLHIFSRQSKRSQASVRSVKSIKQWCNSDFSLSAGLSLPVFELSFSSVFTFGINYCRDSTVRERNSTDINHTDRTLTFYTSVFLTMPLLLCQSVFISSAFALSPPSSEELYLLLSCFEPQIPN